MNVAGLGIVTIPAICQWMTVPQGWIPYWSRQPTFATSPPTCICELGKLICHLLACTKHIYNAKITFWGYCTAIFLSRQDCILFAFSCSCIIVSCRVFLGLLCVPSSPIFSVPLSAPFLFLYFNFRSSRLASLPLLSSR